MVKTKPSKLLAFLSAQIEAVSHSSKNTYPSGYLNVSAICRIVLTGLMICFYVFLFLFVTVLNQTASAHTSTLGMLFHFVILSWQLLKFPQV